MVVHNDTLWFQELAKQIDDYTATYEPEDQLEWSLVLGEIRAFIEVCCQVHVEVYSLVLLERVMSHFMPPIHVFLSPARN